MFAQGRIAACPARQVLATRLQRLLLVLLAGCACCCAPLSHAADGGAFRALSAEVTEDQAATGFLLDAQFSISLSSGAREALENGVPLVFELQVQLVRVHRWFWDMVRVEEKLTRHIEYHDISRTYVVRDLDAGTQRNFRRLEDAMDAAGAIKGVLLADRELLEHTGDYKIRLRGSLDIESLPTPVRLIAYVSSVWDMSSEWYVWSLDR